MQKTKNATSNKTGTAGAEGVDFQLNLILHVLLQVKKLELVNFNLYTELKTAGKFDDIVLIYEDKNKIERSCLLQAKHVIDESKTVSFTDFVSGDKFNLTKYFDSFKEIIKEEQFKGNLEHLILFTNLKLSPSLLPYVEMVEQHLPIWNCEMVEGNEKKAQLYKLNSKFICEYQYFQLHTLSNVIIDYCVKSNEMKHSNNNFKDCHVLLSNEVFNVKENCFRKEFIEGQHLLPETQIFRDIFEEEIQKRSNEDERFIKVDTPKWLQDKTLKFSKEFGKPSSNPNFWPILLKEDDNEPFRIFCSYLILALNQPNDSELEKCLTSECSKYFDKSLSKMVKGELKYKVRKWFKATKSSPLSFQFLIDVFKYIKNNQQEVVTSFNSRREITELSNQYIEFKSLRLKSDIKMFMNSKEKKLFQIITRNTEHLSSIKTIACLSELDHEYLFTSKSPISELKKVLSKSKCFSLLVWQQFVNSSEDLDLLLDQLNDFVKDFQDVAKKVIVIIGDTQNVSSTQLEAAEGWIQRYYDETRYEDLTEDSRSVLLKRNVSFQGCKIEISKILEDGIRLDQVAHDSWGGLSVSGSNIQIGQKVNLSKEYNSHYYIQRTIVMTNPNTGKGRFFCERDYIQQALLDDQDQSLERKSHIKSNSLGCKIFTLSDPAGKGKTTISSRIAEEIKRSHPNYWVARLVAMECVSDLNHFGESTTSDMSYDNFLMSKLLKLSSPLERFVFRKYLKNEKSVNKIIIIFDGYDEINEKCQRVITNLLQYLSRKENVALILITTRPQCQHALRRDFQQNELFLRPFDKSNKTEFLRRYWTSRGINENNHRLTEFADILMKNISGSITETESQLTGIPLQMRMIAEIYEKEMLSCLQIEEKDIGLSAESIGLFDLYEKFIQKKVEICAKDKLKDAGLAFNTKKISSSLHHQSKFARDIIFGHTDFPKVAVPDLELTTQFGIIQQNQDGEFYFIHRTFAEFLTAKYLIEKIIEKDSVPLADKLRNGLLIEQIRNSNLNVVRKFINSKLTWALLAEKCMRIENKMVIQKLLCDECRAIIVTSAKEELHAFLKLTIEVNFWMDPQQIYFKLKDSLWEARYDSKSLTAILQCMLDKWLPSNDVILMKTVDFLIRKILVNDKANVRSWSELTPSTIGFQKKLEKAGMLTQEEFKNILSRARDDVVNQGMYWNWYEIKYFQQLHLAHRNLFYDFLSHNSFLHGIMQQGFYDDLKDFLSLLQSDKEIDPNWVFDKFIKVKFYAFGNWKDVHFKSYFSILHFSARDWNVARKMEFRCYFEEVFQFLYCQYNLSWKGLHLMFFEGYETIISLEEILLKYDKTKTTEDLEYCALWGQTEKLKEILEVGDIERSAVLRFQLVGGTGDLAATRRKILSSIGKRPRGDEDFLKWIGQRNFRDRTILQHAIRRSDDLNIEIISTWITTEKIFEELMRWNDDRMYHESAYASFMIFVNARFPQYRLRLLEISKNKFILFALGREEILRMMETGENMSQSEFVQILKLQTDFSGSEGDTILHHILLTDDICILKKSLILMKKFSLDSETIALLFKIENKNKSTPIDYMRFNSDYVRRQKKKEICVDFLDELNLFALKREVAKCE